MGFDFRDLDERTRALMLAEINQDVAGSTLYRSPNLSDGGWAEYLGLLRAAAQEGNDQTFAASLRDKLKTHSAPRRLQTGKVTKPPVMGINAHEMLAEGEFNRFYIRAVCKRAINEGQEEVVVYRAKAVQHARSESIQKIGQRVSASTLLADLRAHPGVDTALGLPPGLNSGLSVHLPKKEAQAAGGSA